MIIVIACEFGLHWRNRIVVVVIDGLPMMIMIVITLTFKTLEFR